MSTAPCPPKSPRSEKRLFERQRRKQMAIDGDIKDKLLGRSEFSLDQGINYKNNNEGGAISSSPEKSVTKYRENDALNKNRIERVMGTYSDFKSNKNLSKTHGIAVHSAPSAAPSAAANSATKDLKRVRTTTRDSERETESRVPSKQGDLRDRINKRRSCPEPTNKPQVTHKTLREKALGGGDAGHAPSRLEFSKLSRARSSSDERKRHEKRKLSGEKMRSSQTGDKRRSVPVRPRRDTHTESESEVESGYDLKLLHIFSLMKADSGCLSPLSYIPPKRPSRSRDEEESEDELDISRIEGRLKSDGRLSPSERSPLLDSRARDHSTLDSRARDHSTLDSRARDHSTLESRARDHSTLDSRARDHSTLDSRARDHSTLDMACVQDSAPRESSQRAVSPCRDESDIDSDQDFDLFPLSKSTIEADSSVLETTETLFKEESHPSEDIFKRTTTQCASKKESPRPESFCKREPIPGLSFLKREIADTMEQYNTEPVFKEPEGVKEEREEYLTNTGKRRDTKPVVAVNPRVKNSSLSETAGGTLEETLYAVRQQGPSDSALVDIRRCLAQGTPFNLLLSFGFSRLSRRSLQDSGLAEAVRAHRGPSSAHRGPSSDEEGKKEKPSCKVACIPRSDSVSSTRESSSRDSHQAPRDTHIATPRIATPHIPTHLTPHETRELKSEEMEERERSPKAEKSGDRSYHREGREYGYPPKRRRIEHMEYDQFPYHHPAFPNGIPTALAIPNIAYLVQQPPHMRNLLPPTLPPCTFNSRHDKEGEKEELEKALSGLLKFEVYNEKGRVLKKEADSHSNQSLKIRRYMEACIQYVYSALSLLRKQDYQKGYKWLHDTVNIIDYCLRTRARGGLDVRIQDKRLAVLSLLLISHIQRFVYTNRKSEFLLLQQTCSQHIRRKLKEDDQRGSSIVNRSTDSPTPSPAGSLISMASYTGTEVLDSNYTSSHDSSLDTVPSRLVKDLGKYFKLQQHLQDSVEYWDEAGNLAQHSLGYFSFLDGQVEAVTLKTHLYNVARYVGQGLQNLDKDFG